MSVLFADPALAWRIDRAEGELCADFARALTDTVAVLVEAIAGGYAIYARAGAPMNKVVGLGIGEAVEEPALDRIETAWQSRGEPVRVELSELARPETGALLTARGYRLMGFEDVLGMNVVDVPRTAAPAMGGLSIERLRPDDVHAWVDVTVSGWMALDGSGTGPDESYSREAMEQMMEEFLRPAKMQRYLARLDGTPVAAGAMRIDAGLAQLSGATTLPEFRRRGIQSALLAARLRDAREQGCDLAVVTTAPGSKSQANARRQGFQPLYARAVLVKTWGQEWSSN